MVASNGVAISRISSIFSGMAKFIFEMPEDMAALVEAFRVKRGHKATAVAVRELISTGLEVSGHTIGPVSVPARKLPNGGGYMAPSGGPPTKPPTGGSAVQFGPSASAPGSRLDKKGKR